MSLPFYIFAWIASIAYGAEIIIGKLLSKHAIKNPWMFNFFWDVWSLVIILPFAIHGGLHWPHDWCSLILASLLTALAGILYVVLLYYLDVSVMAPLYSLRAAFTVIVGAAFLSEAISPTQLWLIVLIFVASFFITAEENWTPRSFFSKGMLIAVTGMITLAFMSLFINKSIAANGYWTTTFATFFLGLISMFFTIPFFRKDLPTLSKKQTLAIIAVSAFGVLGTLAANKAYETNIGITSVINSLPLSMIAAFAFSYFAPKLLEKHTFKIYAIRFVAAAVMIIAALNLT